MSRTVVLLCRVAAVVCGLVLVHLPARAAILIHEYALRGTLEDNLGGPSLSAFGGEITALGFVFAANQGLSFSSRAFNPANYSIEFSFKLSNPSGTTKLLDFHNLTADPGLYQSDGRLTFSPVASSGITDFQAGVDMHVVLTRDGATNLVTAYVNGDARFSFHDDLSLAAPPGFSNKLSFFLNDGHDLNESGGTLNYLRVFDGALTASEVSTLFAGGAPAAIPEPSTLTLLTLGTAAAFAFQRRRYRSRNESRRPPAIP